MKTRPKPKPIKRPPSTRRNIITGAQLQVRAQAVRTLGGLGADRRPVTPPAGLPLTDLVAAGLAVRERGRVKLTVRGSAWFKQLNRHPRAPLLLGDPRPCRIIS
jgi:hypothetical protein